MRGEGPRKKRDSRNVYFATLVNATPGSLSHLVAPISPGLSALSHDRNKEQAD